MVPLLCSVVERFVGYRYPYQGTRRGRSLYDPHTSITTLVYMCMYDSEQMIGINTDTLLTSVVDVKQMLSIREPINVSHHKQDWSALCKIRLQPTHHAVYYNIIPEYESQ